MSEYRKRYEEGLAIIRAAIDDLPARVDEYIPGISRPDLNRFFQRFAILMSRVDKSGAKHPALLSYAGGNLLERIINTTNEVVDSIRAGPDHFFQNAMPEQVRMQLQLERAVGVASDELKQLSSAVGDDLRAAIGKSEENLNRVRKLSDDAEAAIKDVRQAQSEARKATVEAQNAVDTIQSLREKLEKLASSDGRQKDSLESLIKSVRLKSSSVMEFISGIKKSKDDAESSLGELNNILTDSKDIADKLKITQDEASKILNLSTQAGLAASYLRESTMLKSRSTFFTALLYATAAFTIGVAAFYVIPSLEHVLDKNHRAVDAIPIALLRATVLAPLVYVFYFTSRQINSLEMLRMDYAEKAAASLAYSGYKDEMSADGKLLEQLRASLLLRFAEHPERLLRKKPSQEKLEVQTPGFKATASTADYPKSGSGEQDKTGN